ncbi:hypothetical protein F0919_17645 [Taibaiella lutea]|uniref:Gliding motility lipoprotein GldB n=1 Tax=Taibaiella lutea TaxID=2608001 RepID=A0A5M6CBV1_9BACT|nr:hypothetical protein [Taibaiella lutea]KAA5532606.1 hypothetical protein F0919_17645 [Taibaiella lutea]
MNKLFIYFSIVFGCVLCLFSACNTHEGKDVPDVSKVDIPYQSYAFYKDFSKLNPKDIAPGLQQLKAKYPEFADFYLDSLIGFGYHGNYAQDIPMMDSFLLQKDYRSLLDTVNLAFPDTKKYDEWLKKSFKYLAYYDSTFDIPEHVYYFVSGLSGIPAELQSDKNVGIGLDYYLGRDFVPYAQIGIPAYATVRFTDVNIPIWLGRAIYGDKYPFSPDDKDLLDLIIQRGKELYFLEKFAPYLDEEVKFGFTKEQLDWCKKNESMIYNFFIQNNLLFDKNLQKTLRYVNDGPSSAGMPPESPGNTGSYIGWMIVKKYVERNSVSMHELLETKDAQKILDGSKYKP